MNIPHNLKKNPGWLSRLEKTGIISSSQAEKIEQQEDALAAELDRAKKYYYQTELPKIRSSIREFKKPFRKDGDWRESFEDKKERAKEVTLDSIVEVDARMFALCVNHSDTTPSMYCKDNYAHCFSCGWTGDVIDVLMKRDDISFVEAVNDLAK